MRQRLGGLITTKTWNESLADLRREFRRLIQQHHPDRGGDSDRFQAILAAGKECGLN